MAPLVGTVLYQKLQIKGVTMSDNAEVLTNESEYYEPVLLYHKIELYPQWFGDGLVHNDFTEKVPPDTLHKWNEELNNWEKSIEHLEDKNTETEKSEV